MNNVQLLTTHHPRSSFKVGACIFRPRISLVLNSGRVMHIILRKAYYKDVTVSMLGTLVVTILMQGRGIHETKNNVNFRMDLLTQFQLVDVLA